VMEDSTALRPTVKSFPAFLHLINKTVVPMNGNCSNAPCPRVLQWHCAAF
jgi:hypothetical protein